MIRLRKIAEGEIVIRQVKRNGKRNIHRSVSATLSVLVTFGAAVFSPNSLQARTLEPLNPQEIQKRIQDLTPSPWDGKVLEKRDEKIGKCRQFRVSIQVGDPKTQTSHTQDLFVIRPEDQQGEAVSPLPVMILVPTIEGYNAAEEKIASNLCDMNVATIIADVDDNSDNGEVPPWGLEDQRDRYSVLALRTAIDYAKSDAHFIHDKVGMMGLSLGGILTSFIAGLESNRLSAIVTVVGGGNLPYVLAQSDNRRIVKIRDRRMQAENIETLEEYENRLRETIQYDPMYFASRADREKILMVMSDADTKVPSVVQWDLNKAFGQPVNSVFHVGHVLTIAGVAWMYFDTVGDFLQNKLDLPKSEQYFTPSNPPEEVIREMQCRM
jgi:dienelactone hydrolase